MQIKLLKKFRSTYKIVVDSNPKYGYILVDLKKKRQMFQGSFTECVRFGLSEIGIDHMTYFLGHQSRVQKRRYNTLVKTGRI